MLLSAAHCMLIHQIGTEIGWCIQKKLSFPAWVQFVQMKRQNFTVRSAAKSSAVVCDAHLKQRDYLPVLCTRKIYHPLLLKTGVGL